MADEVQERLLRLIQPVNTPFKSAVWSPDGTRLAVGGDDATVYVLTPEGRVIWQGSEQTDKLWSLAWSPDGQRIASGSGDNSIYVWDAIRGVPLFAVRGHTNRIYSVAWSPDGRKLASGSEDQTVRVWNAEDGSLAAQFLGHKKMVFGISWSPDGSRLASASWDNTVAISDPLTGAQLAQYDGHGTKHPIAVAWSPDGLTIASTATDHLIHFWDAASASFLRQCAGHENQVWSVAWSADGDFLASCSEDRSIRLWDTKTGEQVLTVGTHGRWIWSVAFSPDGTRLASAATDGMVGLWDVADYTAVSRETPAALDSPWIRSQAATVGRGVAEATAESLEIPEAEIGDSERLPNALASLPSALAACHRLGIYPPLSLLKDLQDSLGGQKVATLEPLRSLAGMDVLIRLRWPGPARVGLAVLLMHKVPADFWEPWKPPAQFSPTRLHEALDQALTGPEIAPEAPGPPLTFLHEAAAEIDDRVLTLLTALDPDSVSMDPGLLLRLLPEVPSLPKLSRSRLRLLGLRLRPAESGPAQGSGRGLDRTGLAPTGTILSMAPSQFALPMEVLSWRHRNGGLLYRARTGREPPRFRPAVLVLDVSPACFGPVESLTRVAAHALASTLRAQGLPVVLVLAEREGRVHLLEEPADLLKILTCRGVATADPAAVLSTAERLRARLSSTAGEPVIVLLTHGWWGAETSLRSKHEHLRALFVRYPGQTGRPPWAEACERWESLQSSEHDKLPGLLGRLVG